MESFGQFCAPRLSRAYVFHFPSFSWYVSFHRAFSLLPRNSAHSMPLWEFEFSDENASERPQKSRECIRGSWPNAFRMDRSKVSEISEHFLETVIVFYRSVYTFIVYIIVRTSYIRPTLIDVGNFVLNVCGISFLRSHQRSFSLRLIRAFDRFADVFDVTGANWDGINYVRAACLIAKGYLESSYPTPAVISQLASYRHVW